MKKILTFLVTLVILLLPACNTLSVLPDAPQAVTYPVTNPTQSDSAEELPITDPEEEQVSIDYAKNFTLDYKDGYKLLTVSVPWMGATESMVYALVPEGFDSTIDLEGVTVIQTPIDSIVSLSSTYLPFLEQIGELESLVAVDTADYIYNEEVRHWASSGMIAQVGSGPSVDVEKMIELNPDLIMTSATGMAEYDTHPVLEQAGLPVVINSDYLEQDPLGRAEWSKFIAAFYDKEAQADQLFDEMVQRYEAAKALTATVTDKVSVFINTPYEGTWYMAGNESYAAILLRDAGANYLWDDLEGTSAWPVDFEAVVDRAKEADFWVNVGFASSLSDLTAIDSRTADFKAFQEGKVYNNNARVSDMGGTDYYESGVANPDVVLMDLIKIFYPELAGEHEFFYYQQLGE